MPLIPMVPFPGAHFDVLMPLEARGPGVLRSCATRIASSASASHFYGKGVPTPVSAAAAAAIAS